MAQETTEAARINFADGTSAIWRWAPELNGSGETLAAIAHACLKTPVAFTTQVIQVPTPTE